jgi:hypothetical protein
MGDYSSQVKTMGEKTLLNLSRQAYKITKRLLGLENLENDIV